MREFTFRTFIEVPAVLGDVFEFFARAENLERLTPPWVRFEILTPLPINMGEGTLIDYRIRVRGIWMTWRTKITVWEPGARFVDEQISGPYRQWIHEHRFEATDDGTRVIDTIRYALPFGWIGAFAAPVVQRDVAAIFAFRSSVLAEVFARWPSSSNRP